jgi:exocyst complex component 8
LAGTGKLPSTCGLSSLTCIQGSASSSDGVPPMPDWEEFVRDKTGSSEAKRKTERDIQWIGEWSDELSVAIALKEWEKATSLVEEGDPPLIPVTHSLKQ